MKTDLIVTRRQWTLSEHGLVAIAALHEKFHVIMQQPLGQSRVGRVIHVGQQSSFRCTHIFRADVSAVAYTGYSGSHRGEPAESSSACLNTGSDNIRAVII